MPGYPGRAIVALAFAAVMGALSPMPVAACTCGPSDCRTAASYDAIFEATVDAVIAPPARPVGARPPSPPVSVRLRDLRAIRGEARPEVVTAPSTASCGYRFTAGTRYLIGDPQRPRARVEVTAGEQPVTLRIPGRDRPSRFRPETLVRLPTPDSRFPTPSVLIPDP